MAEIPIDAMDLEQRVEKMERENRRLREQLEREAAVVDTVNDRSGRNDFADDVGSPAVGLSGDPIEELGWDRRWVWSKDAKGLLRAAYEGRDQLQGE